MGFCCCGLDCTGACNGGTTRRTLQLATGNNGFADALCTDCAALDSAIFNLAQQSVAPCQFQLDLPNCGSHSYGWFACLFLSGGGHTILQVTLSCTQSLIENLAQWAIDLGVAPVDCAGLIAGITVPYIGGGGAPGVTDCGAGFGFVSTFDTVCCGTPTHGYQDLVATLH